MGQTFMGTRVRIPSQLAKSSDHSSAQFQSPGDGHTSVVCSWSMDDGGPVTIAGLYMQRRASSHVSTGD